MMQTDELQVVKTDTSSVNGQNKCPKCGATEITLNPETGKLRCDFCRHEFEPVKVEILQEDLTTLEGQVIGSGAQDIIPDTNEMVTFKCTSCGAEVVIDTASSMQARCHWCRNVLSINEQIPNGAIPDFVLPFQVTKEEAQKQIVAFVGKRKFFAHPKFKNEFCLENIMGVYFPYMVVNMNTHAQFIGEGEHLVKTYTRGSGDKKKTYYDADVYAIEREFDLSIYNLTIESNSERLNQMAQDKTNNIINAIMPFDIENAISFDANYLKGYSSERRDSDIQKLLPLAMKQAQDVARFSSHATLEEYDRGVKFSKENVNVKGTQWNAAYLPVWLYSYQEVTKTKKVLHYVAVNARTKETMGSVPIYYKKLICLSILVEILGIVLVSLVDFSFRWAFLFSGFVYFYFFYLKYRNLNARHLHEKETKTNLYNLQKKDQYIERKTGLTTRRIVGENTNQVTSTTPVNQLLESVKLEKGTLNFSLNKSVENMERIIKENIKKESEK